MIGLRAFYLTFQVCKEIGPRLRMLPFNKLAWIREVLHRVSHPAAMSIAPLSGLPNISAQMFRDYPLPPQHDPAYRRRMRHFFAVTVDKRI